MSSQTTKRTLQYLEEAEFLATSIRTQKPTVNTDLRTMYGDAFPGGEGPPEPDWDGLQEANLALIEASAKRLREAERRHRRDQLQLDQRRDDRRGQVKGLKEAHRALRNTFAGTYGAGEQSLVGLDAAPSRSFVGFREQLKVASSLMRDPELIAGLGEPLHGQKPIDFESTAGAQAGGIEELDETTLAIKEMVKRTDESVLAKQEAQREHRRIYSNVARVQEGFYRLAGLDELADRIRISLRASRRKAKEEGAPEGGPEPAEQAEAPEEQKDLPVQ